MVKKVNSYSEEFRKEAVATALRSVSVTQTAKDLG
ncbi:hypothetical protein Psal006b_01558 [Piscirickettsia salmonis]|uniref:Transposase n=1 Tax=Piscirickettsia salmonis TaxID=1238 RepID=A0AAC9EUZ6_PISSA|nr:transposase [Piscirickettsia salmonis]QGN98565.1 hypothetical protein Psal006b_01558 [Piscirickettsia salmonis]QGO02184.1 hypothetical protein Psal008_01571 [Piscirickettsia salmonis]QGO12873.1 hypothetical protein Psal010b_01556 [Piscirickettsia salmonis]QGO19915.1 hypothetical protein Psal013_01568 [Piscirickettsia salmonis]